MAAMDIEVPFRRNQPSFATVAIFENVNGARQVSLAAVSCFPSINDGCLMLSTLERTMPSTIYYEGRTLLDYPRLLVVHTCMEYVNDIGGLDLLSPSWEELMSMPLLDGYENMKRVRKGQRTYVGGVHDIYPPIQKGSRYSMWYLGLRYFMVASHVHSANGVRVEFWPGSYIVYSHSDGSTCLAKVLHCVVDCTDGQPIAICRQFLTKAQIEAVEIQIPKFMNSTLSGHTLLEHEVFYTTESFISPIHDISAVVDCFFTRRSYREWSRRVPLHMAFFCEYMVDITISSTVWQKLYTRAHDNAVIQRLGSSRAFSIRGILPSSAPVPQQHVRVVIFLFAVARSIYDKLLSVQHSFVSLESSYIDCVCDSDMWCTIFTPILGQCLVEQSVKYIRLELNGYEVLKNSLFYGWTDFPMRYLAEPIDVHPHPLVVRVDPTMSFTFCGMSEHAPHLRVGFTCARYVWHPSLHRYESLGVVHQHFSI